MPVVNLGIPGLPVTTGPDRPHQKATMTSWAMQLTFPYLDVGGDLSDLARNWVEQDRPGDRRPILRMGSRRLAKASLKATFADPADAQRTVEPELTVLRAMAGGHDPVVVSFGGLLQQQNWTASGRWVIRDCVIRPLARAHATNAVTWAEADIDLLEANIPGWTGPPPSTKVFPVSIPGAGTGAPRSWTVAAGQSLWSIALAVYGYAGAARWREIGDFNGIVDPRLRAGQVLLIP